MNENEFEFLGGLWVRNAKKDNIITYKQARKLAATVTELMSHLHWAVTPKFDEIDFNELPTENERQKFYENGDRLKEAIFYGDAGAYEHQLSNYVNKKYSLDEEWLQKNKGLDIAQISTFATNIRDLLFTKLNSSNYKGSRLTRDDFNLFLFSKNELTNELEKNENILNLLTIKLGENINSKLLDIGDYNELSSRPFVKLPNGQYFITSPFQVSRALYESPFYWMLSDDDYRPTAQQNRGKIAEDIVTNILSSMFEKDAIFPNVLIKESKHTTITDIDVLLIHEDIAVIFQVKSKRLTSLSKQGDIESIKKDISAAFGYAYTSQGLDAREIILNRKDTYQFEKISIAKINQIKECVIVVVTIDFYPAMMSQIYSLIKPHDECHPIGISIFDLEIILQILKTKNKVIDYFRKRAKYSGNYLADNEMDMLAYHIRQGLDKQNASEFIFIDNSGSKKIDQLIRTNIVAKLNIQNVNSQPIRPRKIRRNDPCPCGQGEKYKNCHGKG